VSAPPRTAAILGAGATGAGWAARFTLMGWDVRVFDPDPDAMDRVRAALARARASLPALYDVALPPEGGVTPAATISETVARADWVQDGTPDRLSLKRKLFQQVQARCSGDAFLVSSSAGLTLRELQGCATRPSQILRVRPAPPVYLMPFVQLDSTDPALLARATAILRGIGMAAGDAAQAAALIAGATGETGATGLAEDRRDDRLVALLRALKSCDAPLAAPIRAHEAALAPPAPNPDRPQPPVTLARQVPATWGDYNGHMTEARYLTAFSEAADRLLLWAGMDAAAIAAGGSVFTVETHIRHVAEVRIGDRIGVTTRVLHGGGRKLHLWHELSVGATLCATGEQLLLHVDLATRRTAPPPETIAAWLTRAAAAQAPLPAPHGVGRHVGQR